MVLILKPQEIDVQETDQLHDFPVLDKNIVFESSKV